MPLYVGDYLADTTHLTCTEHGAYSLLLMTMWRAGGTLPNDPAKLARFARCTPAQWARMADTIMSFFDITGPEITQGRLAREMTKHTIAVKRQRELSSNGGKAKALKTKELAVPHGTVSECQPEPEPEPKIRTEPNGSVSTDFATFWAAYPRKIAKAEARKAFSKAAKKAPVAEMLGGLERAKAGWVDANFIPHAATWLNGERWQDEASEVIQLNPRKAPHDRPHHDAKYDARQANYARAFAGADHAAGSRWEP